MNYDRASVNYTRSDIFLQHTLNARSDRLLRDKTNMDFRTILYPPWLPCHPQPSRPILLDRNRDFATARLAKGSNANSGTEAVQQVILAQNTNPP